MAIIFVNNLQAQNCKIVLSGTVIDASNNAPLENALVEIKELGLKFKTDITGQYRFNNICSGTYMILVNHASCDSIKLQLSIQKNQIKNFRLPHSINELETVNVFAKRDLQVNTIKEELNEKSIQATRGQSLGEMLKKVNGVAVLQTGSTIFKPVIHGLHSQRILLVNNGVRLESQQWGSDHAPEIDPFIAEKFENFISFAEASLEDIMGEDNLADALHYEVKNLSSICLINNGNGTFKKIQLPKEAQFSPIMNFTIADIDQDQSPEIIAIGNLYPTEVETTRYDASIGTVLKYYDGKFEVLKPILKNK